jgi:hypothetical protein
VVAVLKVYMRKALVMRVAMYVLLAPNIATAHPPKRDLPTASPTVCMATIEATSPLWNPRSALIEGIREGTALLTSTLRM